MRTRNRAGRCICPYTNALYTYSFCYRPVRMRCTCADATAVTSRLISHLAPPHNTDASIMSYIRWRLRRISQQFRIRVHLGLWRSRGSRLKPTYKTANERNAEARESFKLQQITITSQRNIALFIYTLICKKMQKYNGYTSKCKTRKKYRYNS